MWAPIKIGAGTFCNKDVPDNVTVVNQRKIGILNTDNQKKYRVKIIKILIINTVPFFINGISTMIRNYYAYIKNMDDIKFDIVVNAQIDKAYATQFDLSKVYILSDRGSSLRLWCYELKKILKSTNYDIVHIHGNSSTMIFETMIIRLFSPKTKIITHCHGQSTSHPIFHKIVRPLFNKMYDVALAASREAGTFLYEKNPFFIVKNGINISDFNFDMTKRYEIRERLGIKKDAVVFLHIGRFNYLKNQIFVVKLLKNYLKSNLNSKLILIGDGAKKEEILNYVHENLLSDQVIFVAPTGDIRGFYSAADLLLFPSLSESFGIVALEAQCSGLPVIMSDRIPKSVMINENCYQLSLDDKVEWLKTIDQIIANDNKGRCAYPNPRFQEFDIQKNAKYLYKKYLEWGQNNGN